MNTESKYLLVSSANRKNKNKMKKIYLFVPQWQDSGLTKELYDGAWALNRYFKNKSTERLLEISVSDEEIPALENNIFGYKILLQQLSKIEDKLYSHSPEKIVTIGGGCGVEIPIVSYLSGKHADLTVLWFDAHGDLNTPETSPSKHFHGMPLRFLAEKQPGEIGSRYDTVPCENIILIGARDLDPPEKEFIDKNSIKVISHDIDSAIHDLGNGLNGKPVYIHFDLDVLDPSCYRNVKCPVNNGLEIKDITRLLKKIALKQNIVGMSILENLELDQKKIQVIDDLFDFCLNL